MNVLQVEDCTVRNFDYGILVNSSVNARLVARGCSVRDVNTSGISISPAASGVKVEGVVTGCAVDKASNSAIYANVFFPNATANLTARDCVVTGSLVGLQVAGSGATLTADNCAVNGSTNVGVFAGSGGVSITRGNNTFNNNSSDGTFTGTLGAK